MEILWGLCSSVARLNRPCVSIHLFHSMLALLIFNLLLFRICKLWGVRGHLGWGWVVQYNLLYKGQLQTD